MAVEGGWGGESWGEDPWGSGGGLLLVGATASRENQIKIAFSAAVSFTGLLEVVDASRPELYAVAPVEGTVGLDGLPARPVSVAAVELVAPGDLDGEPPGTVLALWLDRAMTPWPAEYVVTVGELFSADLTDTSAVGSALQFQAVHAFIPPPQIELPSPKRDLANPQTLSQAQDPVQNPDQAPLGAYGYDDAGDYAADAGVSSFKKRVMRRLMTVPGGFVHLGDGYGVGITKEGKKLSTPARRAQIAANAERQIAREPEAEKVSVVGYQDRKRPGITRIAIRVNLRGGGSITMSPGFSHTG